MSHIQQLGSNLDKQSQMSKPTVISYYNSLIARQNGIERSKYNGSSDLNGYVSDVNLYNPSQLSSPSQMTGIPHRVKLEGKMVNLNKHLDLPRVNEPNKVVELYKQKYNPVKLVQASTSGTYDNYATSNFPSKKYTK